MSGKSGDVGKPHTRPRAGRAGPQFFPSFPPPFQLRDSVPMAERICISRLSHITYYHTDLEKMRVFNRDFGFGTSQAPRSSFANLQAAAEVRRDDGDCIYWGGYGPDAYCQVTVKSDKIAFGGVSWLAASREDLIKASQIPVSSIFF